LEIGILEIEKSTNFQGNETWEVYESVRPKLKRDFHKPAQQILRMLVPDMKTYKSPGSPGGSHWTPYKSTIKAVQRFIRKNPGCTFKQIGDDLGRMHYSSIGSAIGNLRKALVLWEKDWCFVDKSSRPHRCYIKEEDSKRR